MPDSARTEFDVQKLTRLGWLSTLAEPLTDMSVATREATCWAQQGYDTRILYRQVTTTEWRPI